MAVLTASLAKDITITLARLRLARTLGDKKEERISESVLNRLLERVPRKGLYL